eukprot:12369070-Alexandrium_andersonii.AAC.1
MDVEPPSKPGGTSPRASSTSPSTKARACPSKDFRVSADPTITAVRCQDKPVSGQPKTVRVKPGLV